MSSSALSKMFMAALMTGALLPAPPALAKTQRDPSDVVELADNISQLIRSNAVHYWNYVKKNDLGELAAFVKYEGIVAGDAHLGNFGVIPVASASSSGHRSLHFVNIDFDDAGRGPFVLDFARLMITSEAINSEVKKGDLEKAYIAGLNGQTVEVPAKVAEFLAMGVAGYDSEVDDYVAKNTSGNRFNIRDGKIAEYKGDISIKDVESLFPGMTVLDLAQRPEDRGGSAGSLRLWVLVETAAGKQRIFELKQLDKSGMTAYSAQPSMSSLLPKIREVFWPGLDGSSYDLVDVRGAGQFWLREKRKALIDIPYSSEAAKKIAFVKDLAVYDANLLGLAHGRQSSASAYVTLLNNDPAAFHRAIQPLVRAYLIDAQNGLKN